MYGWPMKNGAAAPGDAGAAEMPNDAGATPPGDAGTGDTDKIKTAPGPVQPRPGITTPGGTAQKQPRTPKVKGN